MQQRQTRVTEPTSAKLHLPVLQDNTQRALPVCNNQLIFGQSKMPQPAFYFGILLGRGM